MLGESRSSKEERRARCRDSGRYQCINKRALRLLTDLGLGIQCSQRRSTLAPDRGDPRALHVRADHVQARLRKHSTSYKSD